MYLAQLGSTAITQLTKIGLRPLCILHTKLQLTNGRKKYRFYC